MTPQQVARGALNIIAADLGVGELKVLYRIAERLKEGQRIYGLLDLAADRRDWDREAQQEAMDLSVYLACKLERSEP